MTILEWCIIGVLGLCGFVWLFIPFVIVRDFKPFQAPPRPPLPKAMLGNERV